jgi:hypothetical protein
MNTPGSSGPPPMPGPPPGSLVRAVSGPLLLITLGVLFAIDHLGRVSFGRTWPALFIVFGACKLFERLGVRSV